MIKVREAKSITFPLPAMRRQFTMQLLTRFRRTSLFIFPAIVALVCAWLYWNRPRYADMTAYVPSDCLAFVEVDNPLALFDGIEQSEAWKALATPIGARSFRPINRRLIDVARWTGVGSADAVLLARSQLAIVFTGAETNKTDSSLTIRPLAVLVIETHTSQRRMKPVLEGHLQEFVQRMYDRPVLSHKQVDDIDVSEWLSADGGHRLVAAFADSVAMIGNDEASVLRCIDVRRGKSPSLAGNEQLKVLRAQAGSRDSSVFGFIPKAGIKPLLQAWILSHAGSAPDATTIARLFADVFGNIIDGLSWTSTFTDGVAEDHCFLSLSEGIANQLRANAVPDDRTILNNLSFVPRDAYSVSAYQFRDTEGFWRDLNALVSSHADVVAAIAARPLLRSLFKPYGIDDPDSFVRAAGPHLETIRQDENSPSVLVTDTLDRQGLLRASQERIGPAAKHEAVGDAEVISSSLNNWAVSFAENRFLIGPAENVRACVEAKAQSQTLASEDALRRSQQLVDTSLPIIALTFTDDRRAAISFVELFSHHGRSAFSTNAETINQASRRMPYAVAVTLMKDQSLEWTSRSSFGLLGSLLVRFAPENLN